MGAAKFLAAVHTGNVLLLKNAYLENVGNYVILNDALESV
jgi:hypothetical protein